MQASDLVGYPAVIKPIYGAASIGVVRVDDFEHLKVGGRQHSLLHVSGGLGPLLRMLRVEDFEHFKVHR